jgi:hypothetical protein
MTTSSYQEKVNPDGLLWDEWLQCANDALLRVAFREAPIFLRLHSLRLCGHPLRRDAPHIFVERSRLGKRLDGRDHLRIIF